MLMKKGIKGIGLLSLLLISAFVANAQSSNSSWPVSKGVQRYANKSSVEDENAKKSHIQARSVEFLPIVVSKGPVRPTGVTTVGNIESRGYPTWAISKDVARENQKRNSEKTVPQEQPDMNISKEDRVSKR
ncbi:MAG TPA: hypothetical protein VFD46_05500 [Chryseolinea sp.]|nr:hypothetical protein [Chryseolinea sp.]